MNERPAPRGQATRGQGQAERIAIASGGRGSPSSSSSLSIARLDYGTAPRPSPDAAVGRDRATVQTHSPVLQTTTGVHAYTEIMYHVTSSPWLLGHPRAVDLGRAAREAEAQTAGRGPLYRCTGTYHYPSGLRPFCRLRDPLQRRLIPLESVAGERRSCASRHGRRRA